MQLNKMLLFLLFLVIGVSGYSQVPSSFNYQAIIKDAEGNIKSEQQLNLGISITDKENTELFTEFHSVITNKNGMVSLAIGSINDRLGSIDWSDGPFFISISIDGSNLGSSQLLSVPFSMYSNKAKVAESLEISYPINVCNHLDITFDKTLGVYTKELTDNSSMLTFGFSVCKPNTVYRLSDNSFYSGNVVVGFFSSDNTDHWISGSVHGLSNPTFRTPENCNYIRVSIKNSALAGAMAREDENYTPNYVPYPLTKPLNTKFNGIWNSVGNSITAGRLWQKEILYRTNLDWRNKGQGGQRIASVVGFWKTSFDSNSEYCIDNGVQLITFMGGVNDWNNNAPLGDGEITNANSDLFDDNNPKYDINTISGALKLFIERVMSRFPTARLVIATQSFTINPEKQNFTDGGETNAIGLKPIDYANKVREVAAVYNIPVADVLGNCGWHTSNILSFTSDNIHPNAAGGERIGTIIANKISELDTFIR